MAEEKKTGAVSMELPGVDFAEIVKTVIAEKVTEALVAAPGVATKMVVDVLSKHVNWRGELQPYAERNTKPWLVYQMEKMVEEAAKEALKTEVERIRPRLEKQVREALVAAAGRNAHELVAQFVSNAKSGYGISIEVAFKHKERS